MDMGKMRLKILCMILSVRFKVRAIVEGYLQVDILKGSNFDDFFFSIFND